MSETINFENNKLAILYTTIKSLKEAELLARAALDARVAVCVNIIPGTQSLYRMAEKIEVAAECCMIFKTIVETIPMLERWLLENHPYDTPAILKWDATSSDAYYQYAMHAIQGPAS